MKIHLKLVALVVTSTALAVPRSAAADDPQDIYSYAWNESRLQTGIGVSTILGGGVSGFTDKTMRDTVSSNVSGLWDLRVTLGSHTPLAFDIGYVGTAAKIDALIGTQNGTIVGTTVEGALRWNVLPHYAWNPYAFAGIGWQRYDLRGGDFSLSDTGMNKNDNSLVFPMGAGLTYRDPSGFVGDLHGTFRANANPGLVLESPGSSNYVPMHTWEASGAIGYEF